MNWNKEIWEGVADLLLKENETEQKRKGKG